MILEPLPTPREGQYARTPSARADVPETCRLGGRGVVPALAGLWWGACQRYGGGACNEADSSAGGNRGSWTPVTARRDDDDPALRGPVCRPHGRAIGRTVSWSCPPGRRTSTRTARCRSAASRTTRRDAAAGFGGGRHQHGCKNQHDSGQGREKVTWNGEHSHFSSSGSLHFVWQKLTEFPQRSPHCASPVPAGRQRQHLHPCRPKPARSARRS